MKNSLSKSKFVKFTQCPKSLWMQVYKPEEGAELDANTKARMETGLKVGELAKGLFGEYADMTTLKEDGGLNLSVMINKTREAIACGTEVICEAAFATNDCYCAVDILRKKDNGYAIYEVKSSTDFDKEQYYQDVAYQKWVLTECGINVTGTFLVYINNDYVRNGDLNINELFSIKRIDTEIDSLHSEIPASVHEAQRILSLTEEPSMEIGCNCGKPGECAFWNYCAKHVKSPSVFDLYRMTTQKKFGFYADGKVSFEEMRYEKLSATQKMQVECTLNDTDKIDTVAIRKFLDNLTYPIYFLDFETMQAAIPEYDGTKPYQQVPFQYSLHYIVEKGGELKHTEFLGDGKTDPRRALAEQLCKDIPKGVCSLAYNMGFEKGRINELALAYPDLAEHLMDIHANMKDLLVPFQKGYYYTPAMGGSFSIKSVLPALFPDDPELDYHNLEGCVHNGGEAMTIYPKLQELSNEERESVKHSLLKYCELDTFAMVKVWQKLYKTAC